MQREKLLRMQMLRSPLFEGSRSLNGRSVQKLIISKKGEITLNTFISLLMGSIGEKRLFNLSKKREQLLVRKT
jgi:hypothetical protein